jgi:hypothetical protein
MSHDVFGSLRSDLDVYWAKINVNRTDQFKVHKSAIFQNYLTLSRIHNAKTNHVELHHKDLC